eukprot:gb/GECH01009433.1/.p1 GENE.gb/GECH01009433.1/~~gb/GECH01009433.1/.p1  ORF type:complete len:128 (+),score=7.98 gb/GECH01009433.1/:1-384(+)
MKRQHRKLMKNWCEEIGKLPEQASEDVGLFKRFRSSLKQELKRVWGDLFNLSVVIPFCNISLFLPTVFFLYLFIFHISIEQMQSQLRGKPNQNNYRRISRSEGTASNCSYHNYKLSLRRKQIHRITR